MKIIYSLSTLFILIFPIGCSGPTPPSVDKAKPYEVVHEVVQEKKWGPASRVKYQYSITADAPTLIERAHTAMKAALDLQRRSGADYVIVWLELTPTLSRKGYSIAKAEYAPDGNGKSGKQDWRWQVEASDQVLSQNQIRVAELWETHRDAFQKDGRTDETELKQFISKQSGIPIDDIHLPYLSLKKYSVP